MRPHVNLNKRNNCRRSCTADVTIFNVVLQILPGTIDIQVLEAYTPLTKTANEVRVWRQLISEQLICFHSYNANTNEPTKTLVVHEKLKFAPLLIKLLYVMNFGENAHYAW